MKNRVLAVGLVAASLVAGGCASSRDDATGFPPLQVRAETPEHITLKTFGPPGQQFSGVLTVDGVPRQISGATPAEYPLDCVQVSAAVTNSTPEQRFGFEVSRVNGSSFTPGTDRVCVFRYHAGGLEVLTAQ